MGRGTLDSPGAPGAITTTTTSSLINGALQVFGVGAWGLEEVSVILWPRNYEGTDVVSILPCKVYFMFCPFFLLYFENKEIPQILASIIALEG